MTELPDFSEMRYNALRLLGDAEDELRSDWRPGGGPRTTEQGNARIEALQHIARAKAALDRHVAAIAERVIQACKDAGIGPVRVEGLPSAEWVLIDCGDVLVHVFKPEVRGFYNLEKIWGVDRPSEISGPQDERARIRRVS